MKTVVFYLSWLPYGKDYFVRFLDNYLKCPAGHPHKLIVLFNGTSLVSEDELNEFQQILISRNLSESQFLLFENGQDIEIYQKAASIVDADFFLFLNTYSQFIHRDWLNCYIKNWTENTGLIGASGSYASYLSAVKVFNKWSWSDDISLSEKMKILKYKLKLNFLHRRKFKKFPAPHIRTNAVFTSKAIFISISVDSINGKMDAYFFENGKNSLTERVLKMGLKCIIIDKLGKSYDIPDWPTSKIFWADNQENLLISDNQTSKYQDATFREKEMYNEIAWG